MKQINRIAPIGSVWKPDPLYTEWYEWGENLEVIDHINDLTCRIQEGEVIYDISVSNLEWHCIRISE